MFNYVQNQKIKTKTKVIKMNSKVIEEAKNNIKAACLEYEQHCGTISKAEAEQLCDIFAKALEDSKALKPGQQKNFSLIEFFGDIERVPSYFFRRYCKTLEPLNIFKDEYNSTILVDFCLSDYRVKEERGYLRVVKYGKKVFCEFCINYGDIVNVKAQGGKAKFSLL